MSLVRQLTLSTFTADLLMDLQNKATLVNSRDARHSRDISSTSATIDPVKISEFQPSYSFSADYFGVESCYKGVQPAPAICG